MGCLPEVSTALSYTNRRKLLVSTADSDMHVVMQDQASSKVDAALRKAGSEPQHLAQLLTGQRVAAAVSLASASGDIRLAMLLCQVGTCVSLCKQCCHARINFSAQA